MRALGLMSGTSMDGVDAARGRDRRRDDRGLRADGVPAPMRRRSGQVLRAGLGRWPGDAGARGGRGAGAAAPMPRRWPGFDDIELVGFHGQTLAHEPRGRGTHQVGRGDWLARDCGLPVVWDFRTADVASGGEGAPLVPFFHFACARLIGAERAGRVPEPRRGRQRHLGRSARRGARGAGGAGRLRHRAGQCADRRFPARRGAGVAFDAEGAVAAAGRVRRGGARRAGGASVSAKIAAEIAGPAGLPRLPRAGRRVSRPRTARRRWRR